MDEDRLVETILKYMTDWMMVRSEEERITVLPAVGRLAGQYPSDTKETEKNERTLENEPDRVCEFLVI